MNELRFKDSTGHTIQKGDLILYGYKFDIPVIGKVYGFTRSGIRFVYPKYNFLTKDYFECSSICKRPDLTIVVNHLRSNIVTRELFRLELIDYDL